MKTEFIYYAHNVIPAITKKVSSNLPKESLLVNYLFQKIEYY